MGNGSIVEAHAIIKQWARVGENVRVGHFSVVVETHNIRVLIANLNLLYQLEIIRE